MFYKFYQFFFNCKFCAICEILPKSRAHPLLISPPISKNRRRRVLSPCEKIAKNTKKSKKSGNRPSADKVHLGRWRFFLISECCFVQNAKRYSVLPRLRRNSRRNFRPGLHTPRFFRHVTPVPLAFWTRRKFFDTPDSPRFFRRATKKARAIGAHRKIFDVPDTPRPFRRVTKSARCIRCCSSC